jgi:hypothetical protein
LKLKPNLGQSEHKTFIYDNEYYGSLIQWNHTSIKNLQVKEMVSITALALPESKHCNRPFTLRMPNPVTDVDSL